MFSTNQIQDDQEDSSFSTNQNLPGLQSPANQISALNHLAPSHPENLEVTERNVRNHFSMGGEIDQVCLATSKWQGMKRFLILEHFRTRQQWRERKAASSNSWCSIIIKETKEEERNLWEIIPQTQVWGLSRAGRRRSSLRGTTGGDDGLTISLNLTISLIVQEQKWRRRSFYLTKNRTLPLCWEKGVLTMCIFLGRKRSCNPHWPPPRGPGPAVGFLPGGLTRVVVVVNMSMMMMMVVVVMIWLWR